MDPDLKYLVTTLTGLMQLGCLKGYDILDVDFVSKRILVSNAEGLAKELGLSDRVRYTEARIPDTIKEEFDYHGVIVCSYKDIEEESDAKV